MIDYDVETTGLQPYSQRQYPFLHIFGDDTGKTVAYPWAPDDRRNHEEIQRWLNRGREEGIRAWNAPFDRAFADLTGFDIPGDGSWHDEMLRAYAINERRSVALKAVAVELFGDAASDPQKAVKDWLKKERIRRKAEAKALGTELIEPNYSHVPMDIMEPYALEDVILTRKIAEVHDEVLANTPALLKPIEFEHGVMDALYGVVGRGLPADEEGYRKLEVEVMENLERLEEEIDALVGEVGITDFNPRSTQQIIAALKARGADLSYMSTKDGKLSADADNLRAVDDLLAAKILQFRSEYMVLSTFVRPMVHRSWDKQLRMWKEPFISPDGLIHANYRQVGAIKTGRMSCSDPNIQNQPRDDLRLRYNIRAEEGKKIVAVDLSNIEMVLFAAYCGEGKLLDAVRSGEDLHTLTARVQGFRDRLRPDGNVETARQLGKAYNFSRIYGGGLRTIRRSFRCSQDHARLLKSRFDKAYPEASRLAARIEYRLQDQGYISDNYISGRRWRINPRDAYKGTNYLVQGTAAAVFKEALVKLHKDGVPVVGLVHDEVLSHVDAKDAEEVKQLVTQRLTENEAIGELVPLRADGDIVDRWSDAKPKKDGDGRPYLFTPKWAGGERRYIDA